MGKIITLIARIIQAWQRAYSRKWVFLGVFTFIFLSITIFLGRLGLLPEIASSTVAKETTAVANQQSVQPKVAIEVVEFPTKIEIPKIGLSTIIVNPTTVDIGALDKELLKGAVRYPVSARLGETGNVVLFGHSSYLPIVKNQAYKAFNDIQKLVPGDDVVVYSANNVYTYKIKIVEKKTAIDDGIELSVTGRVLTLTTCNSFGTKEDRFVVTADFVESHPAPLL